MVVRIMTRIDYARVVTMTGEGNSRGEIESRFFRCDFPWTFFQI